MAGRKRKDHLYVRTVDVEAKRRRLSGDQCGSWRMVDVEAGRRYLHAVVCQRRRGHEDDHLAFTDGIGWESWHWTNETLSLAYPGMPRERVSV